MAWNPSQKVADCRGIALTWGNKDQVIVLAVDEKDGTLEMATYGRTRELCADAKRLGDHAYKAVLDHYEDARPHDNNVDGGTVLLVERGGGGS